jgi:chromosomal replication initiation ATPase DnaA
MAATSEPRTHAEMLTRMQQANARQAAAAKRCRLKKARAIVERSRIALERMRRTESGRAALIEAVPQAPVEPPFDPAEVFEILDPEKLAREPKRIISRIAEAHGFTLADILGPRRTAGLVVARHAAIAEVAREHPRLSLPRIGMIFGGRDHTTILHALRKAQAGAA